MLPFEKPFTDFQQQIQELRTMAQTLPSGSQAKIHAEVAQLEKRAERLLQDIYGRLTPWEKVMVARHHKRPKTQDYIARLMEDFTPLSGDRCFGDDAALTTGMGLWRGIPVMVLGHEKGHDTLSRVQHNFGMAHPEGYRKACRVMLLAERLGLPVITLVDTPGAYAGMQAEERGQSQAIAECIDVILRIDVPVVSVVIGEGGSGGAVALAAGNHVSMLEHSVYSVISPEGCASILWRTADKRQEAAAAQKLTAADLLGLGVIDHIITEPLGGAHRSPTATIDYVGDAVVTSLIQTLGFSPEHVHLHGREHVKNMPGHWADQRRHKFISLGSAYLKPAS